MGCFSYMCNLCGEPVLSNSFSGQEVTLFYLKDGKVIERMQGQYDSYGRVFNRDKKGSVEWVSDDWSDMVAAHFNDNPGDGFAAIHTACSTTLVPTVRSDDDPNQGWGEDGEYFADMDPEADYD